MRSIWRTTLPNELVRDVAALAAALGMVGISFGAVAVSAGNPIWVPVLMSLIVFAGGAQFLAIGVVAAGGGVAAAVIGALLLNLRMLPFGMTIGHVIAGSGARGTTSRLSRKLVGSHLLVDESVAFAMANKDDPVRSRQAFWLAGGALFVSWNIGVVVGAVAGSLVGDTAAFGIDAAFPAALLALILPAVRADQARTSALAGAVIALLATPWLPAGIPVLLSLVGVIVAFRRTR